MTDIYYKAKQKPELVEFGPQPYFTAEGKGAPESPAFLQAVQSLYQRAYAARKSAPEKFTVGKLEGLWWAKDHDKSPREEWNWKLMIKMPSAFPGTEKLDEGLVLQLLHLGPFATEPETLARMYQYMEENNLVHNGTHHEVYLSDFRKTAPEKLRTILRQPVKKVTSR
jgi:hypothetical protein